MRPRQLSWARGGLRQSSVWVSCVRLWVSVVTLHWYCMQTYQHSRWGSRPSLLPIRSTGEHGTVWARQWRRRGWGPCTKVRNVMLRHSEYPSYYQPLNTIIKIVFDVSMFLITDHWVTNIMSWEQGNYKQYRTVFISPSLQAVHESKIKRKNTGPFFKSKVKRFYAFFSFLSKFVNLEPTIAFLCNSKHLGITLFSDNSLESLMKVNWKLWL